ncbi:P-loop containing nucleoside triphosphate hydrolase protein [Cucurbitaria berberidis CBS 394.84]|uniref:P-loop containing nucleoside triphosphate hydrolase protein n=1 Tax=Cucurbitaria berberidis CBS 394.84 TaxID=1168544 RepID=A0A9P4GED2_9PLEO|nr:P-loop containing nucleoside triphosphate hydrolase protein [Cucurbitaria berberidis CBS 394.84]KAF1843837.1 P-loop containing nucleoside triphosphate hydrolase protein [Cucurbitaria berberidis CBS 394.84]
MAIKDPPNGVKDTNGTRPLAPEGSLASFKNLYQGPHDSNAKWTWLDKEPEDVAEAAENEETAQHALITRLQNPTTPARTLAEILKDYPGLHCGLKRLEFEAPFSPFVHRWPELLEFRARKDLDAVTAEHIELLYDVLKAELKDVIKTLEDYVHHGIVTFDHVWTIYQPGSTIYSDSHNGTHGAYRLRSGAYVETRCGKAYQLTVEAIDWNGNQFGRSVESIQLWEFLGTTRILGLSAFPLSFHPHEDKVKEVLIHRGKKFEELAGCHYKAYDGFAISWDKEGKEVPYTCNGRVIVDSDSFRRFSPRFFRKIEPLAAKEGVRGPECAPERPNIEEPGVTKHVFGQQAKTERLRLTEEHHLTCLPRVRGYSLKKKQWLLFYLEQIKDIKFNQNAFGSLALPEDQKELILSFAESQAMNHNTFDDVISGKAKGHITLLSGPPGVGKTLTAESVAEHMRAPLFMMSAGDLGINPDVESKLINILEMIAKWNAVLLLDECDVFLEARSTHDLERNKLVSIFLRVLEYYEGLLFLTTNRVDNIDAAFQSRIHISMAYPDLTTESRRHIWENFLGGLGVRQEWKSQDLDDLAKVELNGRQIKNVLKSAALLSSRKQDRLGRKYVDMVLAIERRRPGVAEGF